MGYKANVDAATAACEPVTIPTIVGIYYVNRIPFEIGTGNLPISYIALTIIIIMMMMMLMIIHRLLR